MLQVMELVEKEKIVLEERRISLSEFHTADEVDFKILIFKLYETICEYLLHILNICYKKNFELMILLPDNMYEFVIFSPFMLLNLVINLYINFRLYLCLYFFLCWYAYCYSLGLVSKYSCFHCRCGPLAQWENSALYVFSFN